MRPFKQHLLCLLVIALGASAITTGVALDGFSGNDIRAVGAIIIIGALIRWTIIPALRSQTELFEQGYAMGIRRGRYDDCIKCGTSHFANVPNDARELTGD